MTNCPNCGAPITRHICEYCGTIFPESSCPIQARTMLELKSEYIKQNMSVLTLYEQAMFAMRAYSSGVFTYNEAREHIGLPKI